MREAIPFNFKVYEATEFPFINVCLFAKTTVIHSQLKTLLWPCLVVMPFLNEFVLQPKPDKILRYNREFLT